MKGSLEACVDSYASANSAVSAGADRLELCSHLVIGGATPSHALFNMITDNFDISVRVLIRPRYGDFLYSLRELDEMEEEILFFKDAGAEGIVTGVLTSEGDVDVYAMKRLVKAAGSMKITLHRAFDMCRDPFDALNKAIGTGCSSILTSGQASAALKGVSLLAELNKAAQGKTEIMAGGGINSGNIRKIHSLTGITVFHASCSRIEKSLMDHINPNVNMGLPQFSEYEKILTDEKEMRLCVETVHSL